MYLIQLFYLNRAFGSVTYRLKNYWTHNENDVKPVKVSIEGNIGCGKSTLLERFKELSDVDVITEPLEEWKNVGGENLLELSSNARWSHLFQSYALLTILKIHKRKQNQRVTLMERSVYSCRYCFAENEYRSGKMSAAEYAVYREWFDWVVKEEKPRVDLIVYLRTSPEVCYDRMKKRSREEEADVTLDLLKAIDQLYEEWLVEEKFQIPARVLVLDGNKELKDIGEHYEEIVKNIS